VRDETREPRRSCPDGLHHQAARFRCGARLGPPAQDPPRIPVVDDGDVVATTNERARQALNPHGVPAKVIRRVERRDHGEAEGPSVYDVTSRSIARMTDVRAPSRPRRTTMPRKAAAVNEPICTIDPSMMRGRIRQVHDG